MTSHSATEAAEFSMPELRKISNSEVATWLLCRRKYYYQFDLNLVPQVQGDALARGIIGHEVLAKYYEVIKESDNPTTARVEARKVLGTYMDNVFALDLITDLDSILKRYWDRHEVTDHARYEILEVENSYELPLVEDFSYALRFDLYLRDRQTDKRILMDHKFVYDFWNQDKINLSPQFPKYVGALRGNGVPVDECVLNQIRYRKIKEPTSEQLWQRSPVVPSNAKIRNALKEQITASKEIAAHRFLPLELRSDHALGVRNPLVCKYCEMSQLCQSEFDGGDIKYLIQTEYKQSEYGYNKTTPEEVL